MEERDSDVFKDEVLSGLRGEDTGEYGVAGEAVLLECGRGDVGDEWAGLGCGVIGTEGEA